MRQLHGSDASFLARETPNTPMHIGTVLIYDPSSAPGGAVSFDDILRFLGDRLQLSKTVRERLVRVPFDLDHPYWVEDESFDLEYHVRRLALPPPGGWQQLFDLAAELFSRPLDLTRPPWEMTVIEGLTDIPDLPEGAYALIVKVHHAAIDGLSGIDLMEALHTLKPNATPPLTPDRWHPEPMPTNGELIARYFVNAVSHPIERMKVAVGAAPGVARLVRGLIDEEFGIGDMFGPKSRFNANLSPHRVIGGFRVPLSEVKAIRRLAPGSWVNDVFLTIVGGALHRYLGATGERPERSLTSLVPVSVRARHEKGDMGNQVAAMIVALGTNLSDPVERLRYVHNKTQNSKAMTNALGARNMSDISKVSPALFLAMGAQLNSGLGLSKRSRPPYSTVVTNVPGPRTPLFSAGARLHSMMGLMCLTQGMGLAHVVQSYLKEATLTFTADRELMPDPEFYAECLETSFAELLDAARNISPPPQRTSTFVDRTSESSPDRKGEPPLTEPAEPSEEPGSSRSKARKTATTSKPKRPSKAAAEPASEKIAADRARASAADPDSAKSNRKNAGTRAKTAPPKGRSSARRPRGKQATGS